ncbi:unnamed protein product [Albugo candida]|uniref:Uncharacterized protein n=1 Tax=Albugo candida TaxID=65357 RepID=A0A024GQU1_9STRA|nr:unnamed protein product [Albugo candida]|eukprot:CCI48901.1 unnamed protein product [Albugo candida]
MSRRSGAHTGRGCLLRDPLSLEREVSTHRDCPYDNTQNKDIFRSESVCPNGSKDLFLQTFIKSAITNLRGDVSEIKGGENATLIDFGRCEERYDDADIEKRHQEAQKCDQITLLKDRHAVLSLRI